MAIKLHRCSNTWVKISAHPCWKVQKALDEQGIQYEVKGPLRQVSVNSTGNCYFDVPIQFPSSGSVRLTYTYPSVDRLLPAGNTVYSRRVAITLH